MIRVVVVDDHTGYRDAVARVLEGSGKIHVMGVGGSAAEALRLAAEMAPDVLLLDIDMPGCGLHAAQDIAAANPRVIVAMLTASRDEQNLSAAIKAGARAYILKGLSGRELAQIIDTVYSGQAYVAPALAPSLTPELVERLGQAAPHISHM